jgi:N-acetyltransferase 10
MASTIHGYEGTGRSLSLKLLQQLRQQSIANMNTQSGSSSRVLKEVALEQAIRYADNDPVEDWLNRLLLLDATEIEPLIEGYPKPEDLELYLVNRDTLFSFHKGSENFLKKVMSLFVSSHYKNSPNDLQLLSDAPSHSIFVLCRSIEKNSSSTKGIPDIYAAIQICEEGGISKNVILNNNKRGFKPAGDLIPWTVSEHFQDNEFPHLKGIRVVRIATHPECQRMGYGSRALQLLTEFYEGKIINLEEVNEDMDKFEKTENTVKSTNDQKSSSLATEELKPKKKLKPLLNKLSDTKPPFVYYLGTAFGLTKELFNFWRKGDFYPVYLKLSENDITGEHSCIMLRPFDVKEDILKFNSSESTLTQEYGNKVTWLNPYLSDFKKRLTTLLAYDLKDLSIKLALSLLDPMITSTTNLEKDEDLEDILNQSSNALKSISKSELDIFISKYDYRRLELYTKNLVKYQMIIDIVPYISKFYFLKKFPNVKLAYTQAAILLGFGLQYKSFEKINEELNLQTNQLLALFNKMVKKFTSAIKGIYEKEIEIEEHNIFKPSQLTNGKQNQSITLNLRDDLLEESENIKNKEKEERRKFLQEKFNKLDKPKSGNNGNSGNSNQNSEKKNLLKKRNREDDA